MADEARAMLDALMGGDRNAPLPSGAATSNGIDGSQGPRRTKKSCFDQDIDPLYCAWGVDVYELFRNTKSDTLVGTNPNIPDDAAHEEFKALPKQDQDRLGYNGMLFRKLQELVNRCDRTVNRNKEKLRQEMAEQLRKRGGHDFVQDVDEEALEKLASSIVRLEYMEKDLKGLAEKLSKAVDEEKSILGKIEKESSKKEEKGEHSSDPSEEKAENKKEAKSKSMVKLEQSLEMARIEKQRLLVDMRQILSKHEPLQESIEYQRRQIEEVRSDITSDKTVCEISGNFMSARDADERIAAHYAGKQYVGWKLVRDKLKEMIQTYGRYGPPGGGPPGNDYRSYRGGGGYQRRDNSYRDRSRDGGWDARGPPRGPPRGGGYGGRRDRGGYSRERDRNWRR